MIALSLAVTAIYFKHTKLLLKLKLVSHALYYFTIKLFFITINIDSLQITCPFIVFKYRR